MSKIKPVEFEQLPSSIQCAVRAIPASDHYLIALSGGLDSMALVAFAVTYLLETYQANIKIIHVHHQLSQFADDWAEHCVVVAKAMNLKCCVERVTVLKAGKGLEAAAREVRYQVFERYLSDGGVLLQGHHQNDQAETVLMRLMRGAGPEGLSAIPQQRALSKGLVYRPWLNIPRDLLESEIQKHQIDWVEDDSNSSLQFDRNFLRHEILPLLESRWPKMLNNISRTAERSRQTHQHLLTWCQEQITQVTSDLYKTDSAINLSILNQYSLTQQRYLIRYWLDGLKVEHPSEKIFERIWSEIIPADSDAMPALRWGKNHLRRFNGCLFYLNNQTVEVKEYKYHVPMHDAKCHDEEEPLLKQFVGGRELTVTLVSTAAHDLNNVLLRFPHGNQVVTIRSRQGGESIILPNTGQNKSLKKILQAKKVAPWRREHMPLIYYDNTLVLVVLGSNEFIFADGFQSSHNKVGLKINWQ